MFNETQNNYKIIKKTNSCFQQILLVPDQHRNTRAVPTSSEKTSLNSSPISTPPPTLTVAHLRGNPDHHTARERGELSTCYELNKKEFFYDREDKTECSSWIGNQHNRQNRVEEKRVSVLGDF